MPNSRRRGVFVPQKADRRFVPVIDLYVQRIRDGHEKWGEQHFFPPVAAEEQARDAKAGLYRAGRHAGYSVQADYDRLEDGTYQVWVRVWTRAAARAEIIRRVGAGEELAYNVVRKTI